MQTAKYGTYRRHDFYTTMLARSSQLNNCQLDNSEPIKATIKSFKIICHGKEYRTDRSAQ